MGSKTALQVPRLIRPKFFILLKWVMNLKLTLVSFIPLNLLQRNKIISKVNIKMLMMICKLLMSTILGQFNLSAM